MTQMQKIIFVTISMRGGGTERVISILANCLAKMGYEVTIMMIAESGIEYELDSRIRCICVSEATNGSMLGRYERIRKMRKEIKQDHDAYVFGMGTVASMFTVMATMGLKNKVVVSERNDPNVFNGRQIRKVEEIFRNILYTCAKYVVLQTVDTMGCFPKRLHRKCVVIGNPIPNNLPNPGGCKEREKTILDVGRLIPTKNHQMMIKVFGEFFKKYPEYKLWIFGEGPEKKNLQDLIDNLHLQESVFLKGFSDSIYEELKKGGIYVSTSITEGISNSLIEALAMGIPTIATDCPVGGARACIQDGENGYLIAVNDEEALLDRLEKIVTDSELRKKFADNSIKVRNEYSEEAICRKWLELFED